MVPVKECPDLLHLLWVLGDMETDNFVIKDVLSSLKLTVENKIQMWKMANKMEENIKMSTEVGIKDPALTPTDPPGDEPLSDRVPSRLLLG